MIGDAGVSKRRATPESYRVKNSKGRSHKLVAPGKDDYWDDGDSDTKGPAHRATGDKPGHVLAKDKQNPAEQRTRRQPAFPQGRIVDEWCQGKRGSYK